jgi:transmembrane sensor
MEKSDFDSLLQRYLNGQVTDKEKAKLEAWLEVMKTEDTTHLELTPEDEQQLFQKITSKIEGGKPVTEFRPLQIRKQRNNRWTLRIAASIVFISLAAFAIWKLNNRTVTKDNLTFESVDKMILNDGSLVWLKGNSKLEYFEKDNGQTRYAELTGEALFEVAKDPNRPFVIQCRDISIKVLGTSFSLRSDQDSVIVKVLTGKVSVTSSITNTTTQLEPWEELIYTRGQWKQISFGEAEATAITANTEYNMLFENNTLGEVLARLEKKFNVVIEVSDETAKACRLTADLTDHSLDTSLKLITEVLSVTTTKQDTVITITGKGCQ